MKLARTPVWLLCVALVTLAASCARGVTHEDRCADGIDDDEDGLVDCADEDCADSFDCQPRCGDGVSQPENQEECDGPDLGESSCQSLGFDGGDLACDATCAFDMSGCGFAACGNGVAEALESCDGSDLADQSCITQGFIGGTLACSPLCTFDIAGCDVQCQSIPLTIGDPQSERAASALTPAGNRTIITTAVVGWGAGPYLLSIELYGDAVAGGLTTGTHQLGQGADANYATCGHCILLAECTDGTCLETTTRYFADSGTLRLDHLPTALDWNLRGELEVARWREVVIDEETFVSQPVPGGECFELQTPYAFDVAVDPAEICGDGVDNDGDALIDCDDGDCFGDPVSCANEINCGDSLDNDNDGVTDCADSDCGSQPSCDRQRGVYETFGPGDQTDLRGFQITFVPDGVDPSGYVTTSNPIGANYPEVVGAGTVSQSLVLSDQDFASHPLTIHGSFTFYGVAYSTIHVGSNGIVTFESGQAQEDVTVAGFMTGGPKVAAFDLNLDPSAGGSVTVDEYADRTVVTWDQVPEFVTGDLVSAQVVLGPSDSITLSYPHHLVLEAGIVGITVGSGIAPAPAETDLVGPPGIVVNEVGYNDHGVDTREFVELHGPPGTDLSRYWIVHHDGATGDPIWAASLTGESIAADGFFVFGAPSVANVDLDWNSAEGAGTFSGAKRIEDGPDAIVLYAFWDGVEGQRVDAVGWDTGSAVFFGETTPAPDLAFGRWNTAIGRHPDGQDSGDNGGDFVVQWWATPGAPNVAAQPGTGYERITATSAGGQPMPLGIPDNDPAGFSATIDTSPLPFFGLQTVVDLQVGVRIQHSDTSQLTVTLTAPDNTSVILHAGGPGSDIATIYDQVTQPASGAMSDFVSVDPRGVWTLTVVDDTTSNVGSLQEWVLWINGSQLLVCGDGIQQGAELCDGADVGAADCTTIGQPLSGGTLSCNATCDDYDVSQCTSACGAIYLGIFGGQTIVYDGDTCGGGANYDPGAAGCTGGASAGPERVHQIFVPAGMTANVHMTSMVDNALYVLTGCADFSGSGCVDGSDADSFPLHEEMVTIPSSGSDTTYYLIADAGQPAACGQYTLTVW